MEAHMHKQAPTHGRTHTRTRMRSTHKQTAPFLPCVQVQSLLIDPEPLSSGLNPCFALLAFLHLAQSACRFPALYRGPRAWLLCACIRLLFDHAPFVHLHSKSVLGLYLALDSTISPASLRTLKLVMLSSQGLGTAMAQV